MVWCLLLVGRCWSLMVDCLVLAGCCWWLVACGVWILVSGLLFADGCWLFVVEYLLLVIGICTLLFVVGGWLLLSVVYF